MSHSNKYGKPLAESEEGRPLIKENTLQPHTRPTQRGASVSQGLSGVRKAAREHKEMMVREFTKRHGNVARLYLSGLRLRGAPDLDGCQGEQ